MRRVCVFCGSSPGRDSAYVGAACALGTALGKRGLGLVYGGASVGLMGAVADAALAADGEVIGVIPEALVDRELAHTGLSELHVVASMHERKALMAQLADAFVALPGGLGTLEELFEVATWAMLGLHSKPCALLDVRSYYAGLREFLDHATGEGFLRDEHRAILLVAEEPNELLDRLAASEPPRLRRWIEPEQT